MKSWRSLLSNHLVFIGEIDTQLLENTQLQLQAADFTLHTSLSATEAASLIETYAPAAVLIDIARPENHGITHCESLRQSYPDLHLIALNYADHALAQLAVATGADVVLNYPLNVSDLRLWLNAPRTLNRQLAPFAALMGQDPHSVLGSTSLLAHDLKSPLSMVITSLEVLMSFSPPDAQNDVNTRLMRGALHAAYHQMNMLSDLIDLARLEINDYTLQLEQVDLIELLHGILEQEAYTITIKGLQVELDLPGTPLMSNADRTLMQRVFAALLEASLKFTIRGDTLTIKAHQTVDQIVLQFTDTGRPIREGFEDIITQRLPQWEPREAGTRTSVGIGLPFIAQVAQAHGGSFAAKSDLASRLTTFTLTLPLA
jgi:signal transduction histidine kinase